LTTDKLGEEEEVKKNILPAPADNRMLEVNTQGLRPSQAFKIL
jgi:hypothetical protein